MRQASFAGTDDVDSLGGVDESMFGIEHVVVEAGQAEEFGKLRVVGGGDDAVDGKSLLEFLFGEVGLDEHEVPWVKYSY